MPQPAPKFIDYDPEKLEQLNQELIEPITPRIKWTGRIKLKPASFYQAIAPELLLAWCNRTARYTIPTIELIAFLKELIGKRSAIEIGAGNGDLGYHLGILETDSYMQQEPEVNWFYVRHGQVPTNPPLSVEKLEAVEAIKKYRPQVVVASWLTQRFIEGDGTGGSSWGVMEEEIIERCTTYIHIGNATVDGNKRICKLPHKTYKLDGLITRSQQPDQNIIRVWEKI